MVKRSIIILESQSRPSFSKELSTYLDKYIQFPLHMSALNKVTKYWILNTDSFFCNIGVFTCSKFGLLTEQPYMFSFEMEWTPKYLVHLYLTSDRWSEETEDDFKGKNFDAIIHLAGLSNDPLGELSPHLTEEINFHSTIKLAKIAKH